MRIEVWECWVVTYSKLSYFDISIVKSQQVVDIIVSFVMFVTAGNFWKLTHVGTD